MTKPINLVLGRLNRMDEKLGRMDGRLARMEDNQCSMVEELRAHKPLIASALHSRPFHEAEPTDGIERIERRLELREEQ